MKPRFDDALLRTWSNMKRHGVSLRTWVEVHRDILGLFMEMDDLEAIVKANGDILSVAPQVQRLVAAMNVGRALFGGCLEEVEAAEFSKALQACVAELAKSKHTAVDVTQAKFKMMELAGQTEQHSHHKRQVKIGFLGQAVLMDFTDAMVEWQMHFFGHIKHKLLHHDKDFPRLPYEEWFLPATTPLQGMQVMGPRTGENGSGKGGRCGVNYFHCFCTKAWTPHVRRYTPTTPPLAHPLHPQPPLAPHHV